MQLGNAVAMGTTLTTVGSSALGFSLLSQVGNKNNGAAAQAADVIMAAPALGLGAVSAVGAYHAFANRKALNSGGAAISKMASAVHEVRKDPVAFQAFLERMQNHVTSATTEAPHAAHIPAPEVPRAAPHVTPHLGRIP